MNLVLVWKCKTKSVIRIYVNTERISLNALHPFIRLQQVRVIVYLLIPRCESMQLNCKFMALVLYLSFHEHAALLRHVD
jgi:hypothetical protein